MPQTTTRPSPGRRHRIHQFAGLSAVLTLLAACSSAALSPTASLTLAVATASPAPTVKATAQHTPAPTPVIVTISPIPGAPDSGKVVKLAAHLAIWSLSVIHAPAGKVWHIRIDDQDGAFETHNFTVASGSAVAERIFMSPNFRFGISTFDIPALPAGSYLFICTIHPESMTGTLTIG
jgi:Cupredoxin-like domain